LAAKPNQILVDQVFISSSTFLIVHSISEILKKTFANKKFKRKAEEQITSRKVFAEIKKNNSYTIGRISTTKLWS
jgi:hypothetical protein